MNTVLASRSGLDAADRAIIVATQEGLPLVERPYDEIARQTGLSPDDVKNRLLSMLERGVIRRIGVVPNHY
ncbi:MAG TPA: Lrp/AsnC family transcriptional regulator, partial [Rhizobiales bacterium]|nr:Lrp/AsnC family transcriptional regulator [Hyphomicrobiales bacterium]